MSCAYIHKCTVSPVEKLTNRTTGTLPVRSRYGHGTVAVRSRCGRGVRSRYGRGTFEVRSRYRRGTVEVRSRCVRYSLGTLPVRSLYGILKVRSRLVFLTRLKPGTRTARFSVGIAASWIRFSHRYYIFNTERIADSDRDNKLSVIR